MAIHMRSLCAVIVGIMLSSCATLFPRGGEEDLAAGILAYEAGEYPKAAKSLQKSVELGLYEKDQVKARKYLAFIHCLSGREAQCRAEFRLALAIDPAFELEAAEAGHPRWGPVFRSAKVGR